jgi:RHS repeat-associated protein
VFSKIYNLQCAAYTKGIPMGQFTIFNNKETPRQPTDATGYVDQHTMCRSIFYGVLQASLCSTNTNKIQIGMQYLPFGELFISQRNSTFDSRYKFTAKELDNETNYTYFGARYYDSDVSIWLSVDPLSDKYPSMSPFMYCAGNPVNYIDPNGMEWEDLDGNSLNDDNQHKNILVYIFYDPSDDGFTEQSKKIASDYEKIYGKGTVALSEALSPEEFAEDWANMSSENTLSVYINYHGSNQALHLPLGYVTSTGNGKTNVYESSATNVQDLPEIKGNVRNAALYINSCKSNNSNQFALKGTKETLMVGFRKNTDFLVVRGTSGGVNYSRINMHPIPSRPWNSWDYMVRQPSGQKGQKR